MGMNMLMRCVPKAGVVACANMKMSLSIRDRDNFLFVDMSLDY